ncbi:hypothetical protein [Pelagicoccus mobilis]|uniref:Uncharacterized protein n=1 Tax=Pelagicoccus mobilis TaxID=415221 RepID=A0A934RUY3_9BACT|nr:hypothetical protein [Pelagicoccus mobilis]MBK1876926.1 hypothetical protein [Pelagicoccus mobilis]
MESLDFGRVGLLAKSFGLGLGLFVGAQGVSSAELKIDGSMLMLAMGRDYGGEVEGESVSASLTLDFESDLSDALRVGAQLLHVERLDESGIVDAGYWLSNDSTSEVNELYLDWKLVGFGSGSSRLKIGRQSAGFDFMPSYKVRHKSQAFEGIRFETKVANGVALDFGHVERCSSWSCREGGPSTVNADFIDFSERLGFGGGDRGVQFASAAWEVNDALRISGYDYYADGFYNNMGGKLAYRLPRTEAEGDWIVSAHFVRQDGMSGGAMSAHEADMLELNLRRQVGGLTLDTGWAHVGRGSDLAAPFRTSFVIDATLLWYTEQYAAGSDSLYLKSVYRTGPWTLVGVLVGAFHANDKESQEFDTVIKYAFENDVWVAFKGGLGRRRFDEGAPGQDATDLRLFVGYSF